MLGTPMGFTFNRFNFSGVHSSAPRSYRQDNCQWKEGAQDDSPAGAGAGVKQEQSRGSIWKHPSAPRSTVHLQLCARPVSWALKSLFRQRIGFQTPCTFEPCVANGSSESRDLQERHPALRGGWRDRGEQHYTRAALPRSMLVPDNHRKVSLPVGPMASRWKVMTPMAAFSSLVHSSGRVEEKAHIGRCWQNTSVMVGKLTVPPRLPLLPSDPHAIDEHLTHKVLEF